MSRIIMVSALSRALGCLPLPINHGLGAILGLLLWLIPNRQKATAIYNIERCFPELSAAEKRRLIRRTLGELGKSVTELGVLWNASESRLLRLVKGRVGEAVWQRVHTVGRPVLVCAPHIGAFEALNLYASRSLKLRTLYRQPRQLELESLMLKSRERFGSEMIRADRPGLVKLVRDSSQDDVIAILPDQVPKKGQGVDAPFFGHLAPTMVLFGKLTSRFDAYVISAFAERLSWGRGYRLHFYEVQGNCADPDAILAATALNAAVESCVRKFPHQYQWPYARFGRRA